MKKRKAGDELDGIREVDQLASWVQRAITVIGFLLAGFFTWLQWSEFPFANVINSATPEILLKIALVIYYFSWVFGATFDLRIQQKVYVADPYGGTLNPETVAVLVGFFAAALILLWASSDIGNFSVALGLFVAVNIIAWIHVFRRTKPLSDESKKRFMKKKSFHRLEELNIVENYMFGDWQKYRFAFMAFMASLVNAVTFYRPARAWLADITERLIPNIVPGILADLTPGIFVILFVVSAEGWIWTRRLSTYLYRNLLEDLGKRYRFVRG